MVNLVAAWRRTAPPRSAADAEFLNRYTRYARPAIIAAAVLPLIITVGHSQWLGILIGVGSWLVFVFDFVVQSRRRVNYLNSRLGMFDFSIVLVTSPWYLIPGVHGGVIVVILRLARLLRVLVVFRGVKRLIERLGRAVALALIVVLLFSYLAYDVEHPVNPEFASYGDSLWWGIVTLTTVGYGDIVPITVPGRIAAVVIMVMGVALLGVIAGSLASFLRLSPQEEEKDEEERNRLTQELGDDPELEKSQTRRGAGTSTQPEPPSAGQAGQGAPPTSPAPDSQLAALTREVIDLREQIARLSDHMGALTPPPPTNEDPQPPPATI